MNWISITSLQQVTEIIKLSKEPNQTIAIFKHSTRCGISSMALHRLERKWKIDQATLPAYFLDLLKYREISDEIARIFNIRHESPQLLLIRDGICVYNKTHNAISAEDVEDFISRK